MRRLELDGFPLSGTRLIEASAGTGKTFTIAALYLRLLLDAERDLGRDLDLREILVVTFTEAATEELRERIRRRLRTAADAFAAGKAPDDDEVLAALLRRRADHDRCAERLREMLTRLDEAPIHTIHGFCHRTLRDHAFECGTVFRTELIGDEGPLREALIEDFWRSRFYGCDEGHARWVRREWPGGPRDLLRQVDAYLSRPRLRVVPEPDPERLERLEARLAGRLDALPALWREGGQEARRLLDAAVREKVLSGAKDAYKGDSLDELWPEWDEWFRTPALPLPRSFALLTESTLREKRLKKARDGDIDPPRHELFATCEAVAATAEEVLLERRIQVLQDALGFLREGLRERKAREQQLSFDDLLTTLSGALRGPGGGPLADAVARRYPVALIDEFQDTDPEQYEIFHGVYDGRPGSGLFMIGDPKQAIYSFRGADVFTYMQARRATDPERDRFTLGTNFRSTDSLVRGVDALFRRNPRRFIYDDDIELPPVEAAGRADGMPLTVDGETPTGLQVWFVPREDGKPVNKGDALRNLSAAFAGEIARLLELGDAGRARLGERPLAARDIAVLVRSHREAATVRRALAARGVASVHHSRDSVFASEEAADLERVLRAVAEPEDERRLRAAVCTRLMGLTGPEIHAELEAGQPWERRMEAFARYRARWESHGFLPMLHTLMHEQDIIRRVFALPDAERRMTNLLHLGELLQEAAAGEYGITGLLRWLREQLDEPERLGEASELRLESDEALVKIVTVHKSKGLQYPVVFLPFAALGREPGSSAFPLCHREDDAGLVLDLGSEAIDRHRELAAREAMAEELRLLYVSLTRASHCCYLAWGGFRHAEHSGLGYLLCPPADPDDGVPSGRVAKATDEELRRAWTELEEEHGGIVAVTDIGRRPSHPSMSGVPPEPEAARGRALPPPGRVRQGWRLTSYTGLLRSHAGQLIERPDYDELEEESAAGAEEAPATGRSLLGFPRGARAGVCLHRILEQADFTRPEALESLVSAVLPAFGFDPAWTEPVAEDLRGVLATALDPESGLRLGRIARTQRLDELSFFFPAEGVDAAEVDRLLPSLEGAGERPPLTFGRLRGMVKGYIDLVLEHDGRFYLVDYKSNHLGARVDDYAPRRLHRAIAASRYDLQYTLYALALHRYLGTRLADYDYERHFGGVYYLFLRGMTPERGPSTGVFHARPERALMEDLDALFAGGVREVA